MLVFAENSLCYSLSIIFTLSTILLSFSISLSLSERSQWGY